MEIRKFSHQYSQLGSNTRGKKVEGKGNNSSNPIRINTASLLSGSETENSSKNKIVFEEKIVEDFLRRMKEIDILENDFAENEIKIIEEIESYSNVQSELEKIDENMHMVSYDSRRIGFLLILQFKKYNFPLKKKSRRKRRVFKISQSLSLI